MAELVDLGDKIKRYYFFTTSELGGVITSILVLAFIISFNEWGKNEANIAVGLFNLFNAVLIVALSMLIHISAQRVWSLATGYRLEWRMWGFGLLFGLIVVFLSNGKFIFLAVGGLSFYMIEKLRIGHPEPFLSYSLMGWLSVLGPLASIVIAVIAKLFTASNILNPLILSKLISVNLWIAVFSILPFPFVSDFKNLRKWEGSTDGLKMFFASRIEYAIVLILIFLNALSVLLMPPKGAFYITIFFFILMYLVYYLFYRQNVKAPKKMFKYYQP